MYRVIETTYKNYILLFDNLILQCFVKLIKTHLTSSKYYYKLNINLYHFL